jgi:hypothetical protein
VKVGAARRLAPLPLLLAAALAGCDVGGSVPRCTLDPAELQVTTNACQAIGVALISGTAFSWGECGAACPRPWTITVRWTNRTTGATGEQQLGWHTSSCYPFGSSCGPDPFNLSVPVGQGTNEIELAADEGDGYTACTVVLSGGC